LYDSGHVREFQKRLKDNKMDTRHYMPVLRAKNYILKLHNNRDVPNRLSNQLPKVRLYRRGFYRGRNYHEGEMPHVRVPR
jgi:hypothetical protein